MSASALAPEQITSQPDLVKCWELMLVEIDRGRLAAAVNAGQRPRGDPAVG